MSISYEDLQKGYQEASIGGYEPDLVYCGVSFMVAMLKKDGYTQEQIDEMLERLKSGETVEGFRLVDTNLLQLGG